MDPTTVFWIVAAVIVVIAIIVLVTLMRRNKQKQVAYREGTATERTSVAPAAGAAVAGQDSPAPDAVRSDAHDAHDGIIEDTDSGYTMGDRPGVAHEGGYDQQGQSEVDFSDGLGGESGPREAADPIAEPGLDGTRRDETFADDDANPNRFGLAGPDQVEEHEHHDHVGHHHRHDGNDSAEHADGGGYVMGDQPGLAHEGGYDQQGQADADFSAGLGGEHSQHDREHAEPGLGGRHRELYPDDPSDPNPNAEGLGGPDQHRHVDHHDEPATVAQPIVVEESVESTTETGSESDVPDSGFDPIVEDETRSFGITQHESTGTQSDAGPVVAQSSSFDDPGSEGAAAPAGDWHTGGNDLAADPGPIHEVQVSEVDEVQVSDSPLPDGDVAEPLPGDSAAARRDGSSAWSPAPASNDPAISGDAEPSVMDEPQDASLPAADGSQEADHSDHGDHLSIGDRIRAMRDELRSRDTER